MEPPGSLALATPRGGRPPAARQSRFRGGKLDEARQRALALVAFCPLLALLAGCPNSWDELLNKSRLNDVQVVPNPVPTPPQGGGSAFGIRVDFDSNNDSDVLRVLLRDPHDRGRFRMLGYPSPCPDTSSGGHCGIASYTFQCHSILSPYRAGERNVNCGAGAHSVDLPPGQHTLRVEIIQHLSLFQGFASEADDAVELTLTVH